MWFDVEGWTYWLGQTDGSYGWWTHTACQPKKPEGHAVSDGMCETCSAPFPNFTRGVLKAWLKAGQPWKLVPLNE